MSTDNTNNTFGIPTSFTIALSHETMIFMGVALAVWIFHKQIIGR